MDNQAAPVFVFLFVFTLPASMYCWAVAFQAAGYLRDPADQWDLSRFATLRKPFEYAAFTMGRMHDGPMRFHLAIASVGIVILNLLPVAALVTNRVGGDGLILSAYFVVHGIWLASVVRTILRTRSGHEGG